MKNPRKKTKKETAEAWKRRLFNFLFTKLPRPARHRFYRQKYARVPVSMPEGLTFELARTQEDLEASFKLLHNVYVEQGFIEPQHSGMRLIVQHALPTSSILIAKSNGRVIGTISVMRDTPLGLPMEKAFDLSHLRIKGKRVAELSCLAIHPDFRRKMGGHVFFPLTLFAAIYTKNLLGADYLVWNLYPHHTDFYNAIFGSKHLSGSKISKEYLGAPASGIQLDLEAVQEFARKNYAHLGPEKNLYEYAFITQHSFFKYPPKEAGVINYPVMTPRVFHYFFAEKTKILQNMSQLEKQVVARYYPLESYADLISLSEHKEEIQRKVPRWDIRIAGEYFARNDEKIQILFLDVSFDGFKVHANSEFNIGQSHLFEVKLSDDVIAKATAVLIWQSEDKVCGFKILDSNDQWIKLIEAQEKALKAIAA